MRPWPRREAGSTTRSASRSRSMSSSGGCPAAGSAAMPVTSTTRQSNPPRVAGRCDLDGSAWSSAPTTGRRRSGPDWRAQLSSLGDVVAYYRETGVLRTRSNGVAPIETVTAGLLAVLADDAGRRALTMVTRKSRAEIERMRRAGRIVAEVLDLVGAELRPGVSTGHLDRLAEAHIRAAGAIPSFKGYPGSTHGDHSPASICISIDDEIVHGIPGERIIREGQIVSVDAGAILDGWHGDAARTFFVGEPPAEVARPDRGDPGRDAGRDRRRRPGQPHRGHLGRGGGRRPPARVRGRPTVRRPRDRHRDARGAAGPQLPHRAPRSQAGVRPVPGHRADVHPRAATRPASSPTTGRCPRSTAPWPPISSTRSP